MNKPDEIKRLLIVRNDRVGDLVLTLPALQYARRVFRSAEICLLASHRTASLLDGNAHVDRVFTDDGSKSAGQLGSCLKVRAFDAALVINATTRNFLAVWLAGIPRRVTWARKPVGLLLGNRRVTTSRSHPPIHESQFALAFVRRLHDDPSVKLSPPAIHIDVQVSRRVRSRIDDDLGCRGALFGIHPGNYRSAYNWPPQHYRELAVELADHGRVIVTGGPGEEGLLEQMKRQLPGRLSSRVAFYHEFDLMELSAAIARMDVLTVSNTGPMHLAGVLGTPLVALFSAHPVHRPEKWAPFGSQTTLLRAPLSEGESPKVPHERASEHMSRITVEQVLSANLAHLQNRGTRRIA